MESNTNVHDQESPNCDYLQLKSIVITDSIDWIHQIFRHNQKQIMIGFKKDNTPNTKIVMKNGSDFSMQCTNGINNTDAT